MDSSTGRALAPTVLMVRDSACLRPLKLLYSGPTGAVAIPALTTGTYCLQVRGLPAGYAAPPMKRIAVHPRTVFTARIAAAPKPVTGSLAVVGDQSGQRVGPATFMLRDATCVRALRLVYGDTAGAATLTDILPATYCLTPVRVPAGFVRPAAQSFGVTVNRPFQVSVRLPQP
ncbi:MSCRAMM family protein [Nakamurella endophytica]|uniref:MSCRAMM family protein n=1 Tax=Nakamurella endophytica TaxID=1748367 RepID=UPI001E5820DA|nr:hypothetical protein [Nakamurella endophytica]